MNELRWSSTYWTSVTWLELMVFLMQRAMLATTTQQQTIKMSRATTTEAALTLQTFLPFSFDLV